MDLVIAGGAVTTAEGRFHANIGVAAGRIQYVGPERPAARETIDADGQLVLPGGVDTHVHLMDPGDTDREDFAHGTSAAVAAGVTTIIEHGHGNPVVTVDQLTEKRRYLAGRAHCDFALAAHAMPCRQDAMEPVWREGAAFFKVFTCTTHGIEGHDAADVKAHFAQSAELGARSLVHCEDHSMTATAERRLRDAGYDDGGALSQWRSRDAELVAATTVAILARKAGAVAVIAHVSHPEVAAYIARERAQGAQIYSETCPQYLFLRESEALSEGALRKFTPPARARTTGDRQSMIDLLREGTLTHVSSDHAPSTIEQKCSKGFWDAHFGLPGLDTTLPMLLDAAHRGEIAYEDIVKRYCEVPARIYGLWPTKGALRPGADADIVLVDPDAEWQLGNDQVLSKAGWSPYAPVTLHGMVTTTFLRGQVVCRRREPTDERTGRFVAGAGLTSSNHD